MYTLRRITEDNTQINLSIGESYCYDDREQNYEEFKNHFHNYFQKNHVADLDNTADNDTKLVYGFISFQGNLMPLYKNQMNYIMTESGKTFSNLSYR